MRLLPVLLVVSASIVGVFTSCSKGGGGDGGGGDDDPAPTSQILTPSSEGDGAVTAAVSASSADTLILNASGASSIAGSSVEFPPGSLAIDVNVTLEPGITLDGPTLESDLGLGAVQLEAASGAVVVSSEPATNAVTPFTIALSLPAQSLAPIDLTNLVVVFKRLDAVGNTLELGVLPKGELTIEGLLVKFKTQRFGVFQAMVSSSPIDGAIVVTTTEPIETLRDLKDVDEPVVPAKDKKAPKLVDQFPKGEIILKTATLKAIFGEGIDLATVQLFGDLADSVEKSLGKTNIDNDTLILAPKTVWPKGGSKNLAVVVKDDAGNEAEVVVFDYEIIDKIFYVRDPGDGGNDINNGTSSSPYGSIVKALTMADDGNSNYIFVAAGNFTGAVSIGKGARLLGGFPANSWATRDAKNNETKISCSANCVLFSGSGSSSIEGASLRGFTVETGTGGGGSAIEIYASNYMTTVADNYIHRRLDDGGWAVVIASAPVTIVNNTIEMGTLHASTSDSTKTLQYTGTADVSGGVTIARNTFIGATVVNDAYAPHGLYIVDSDADTNGFVTANVHNNVFRVGDSVNSSVPTRLLEVDSASVAIRNNTFVVAGSQLTRAVYLHTAGGTPDINFDNNIMDVTGTDETYCLEIGSGLVLTSTRSNLFRTCVDNATDPNRGILYGDSVKNTVADVNGMTDAEDNIGTDPGFVDAATFDFHIESAAVKAAGISGEDAAWTFYGDYVDRDGTPRTGAWSIGAYE